MISATNSDRCCARSIIKQVLTLYGQSFGKGLEAFSRLSGSLTPLAYFYLNHRAKFLKRREACRKKRVCGRSATV